MTETRASSIVRPSIFDLDIAAPDILSSGRITTFTSSAGSMALRLEFLDSATGAIQGRIIDRRRASDTGRHRSATVVSNTAEADRILRLWASQVREYMETAAN